MAFQLLKDAIYGREEWTLHFHEDGYACELDVSLSVDDLRQIRNLIDRALSGDSCTHDDNAFGDSSCRDCGAKLEWPSE